MRMPKRTSRRTFLDEVFIWNAESFWRTSPTLTYLMSFIIGVGSHCVTSRSHVFPCWFRSFTPTYMELILQYLFHTCVWGTCIVVTSQLVANMLHVPRVEYLDYPWCDRLRTMSKDEMIFAFCERLSDWGDRQFTPCKALAKGPILINMVTTFVLHPLSHYNSITEPCAWFLLSLLEHLTIDFPSHFILSFIDVYRDTATCDKLIFPLLTIFLSCVP